MTISDHSQKLRLYYTPEFACPYLEDQIANNVILDPNINPDPILYTQMLARGYRRNGSLLYRPNCTQCKQCVSTRIEVNRFRPSRAQRRCVRKNHDLTVRFGHDPHRKEYRQLYGAYMQSRHQDTVTMHDYDETLSHFLESRWIDPLLIEFHDETIGLVCVAIVDSVMDGWSDVYTFYHPQLESRSLGTYAILWQINHLRDLGKRYLYLGYYIKDCHKMAYKLNFQPLQLYDGHNWLPYLKKP